MAEKSKKTVEVVIEGQVIPLSGVESEEYITALARYIDKKIQSMGKLPYNNFLRTIAIAVNIADDLFTEKSKSEELAKKNDALEKNIIKKEGELLRFSEKAKHLEKENSQLKEQFGELESFSTEIDRLTEENTILLEKLQNLQGELIATRRELSEYIQLFDETASSS